MTNIFRLDADGRRSAIDNDGSKGQRVARAPLVVALKIKGVAVQIVGSAFGDGVGHAAGGAAVFRRIIRGVDLKLADRRLTDRIAQTGAAAFFAEERLVVVAAVNGVVVEQAGNAAETDQPEATVGNRAGRQNREVGPAAAVDRQFVDLGLIDVGGELLRFG